jgi:antitoxin YefM
MMEGPMQSTYRVRAGDLTTDFLKALKLAYKDKEIEIVVTDIVDETDYLLGNTANREHLLKSLSEIASGSGLVSMDANALPVS